MKLSVQNVLRPIIGIFCLGALLFSGCITVNGMRKDLESLEGEELNVAQEKLCQIVSGHKCANFDLLETDHSKCDTFEEKVAFLDLIESVYGDDVKTKYHMYGLIWKETFESYKYWNGDKYSYSYDRYEYREHQDKIRRELIRRL